MFDLNIFAYPVSEKLTPPGFALFPPSRKSARGRENDLLMVYFSLVGQTSITPEGLLDWMGKKAEGFQRNPGTVTAGMRELIESVNNELYERNVRHAKQSGQVTLNLQVAVVRRGLLYLANCGKGQSFFIGSENNFRLQDSENSGRGLGVSQSVPIRFVQSNLATNDLLILSLNPPEIWTDEVLAGGQSLSIEAFQRRLFSTGSDAGTGVLVRFQEGAGKINYLRIAQATAAITASEQAIPPAQPPAAETEPEFPFKRSPEQQSPNLPDLHAVTPAGEEEEPEPRPASETRQIRTAAIPAEPKIEEEQPEAKKEPAGSSGAPLIQTETVKAAVGNVLRTGAKVKGQVDNWVKDVTRKIIPGDPSQPVKISRGLLIFITIAIPVLIVAIAMTLFFRNVNHNTTPQYLALAQQLYQQADTQSGDEATSLANLQQSIYWLDKADQYGKSADSITLRNTVQTRIDALEGIIRVDMSPALSDILLPNVNITQMVATNTDLYALDNNSGDILHFTLTGSTYQKDTKFSCGPDPKNPLSNIGKLVDMVPISPDNSYNATILAVDAVGTLDYCVPQDAGYTVKLPAPDMGWGAISSISLYQENLYVLDIKGNAVYRFEGTGVDFPDKPTLFFDEVVPPLSDALDIEVYGYQLYILRGNGQMIECTYSPIKDMKSTTCETPAPYLDTRSGQDLTVNSFPDAQFTQMRMTDAPDSSIYLLDASKDSIYHFSYARSLQRVLHPRRTDGTDSATLTPTAFAVSTNRELFVAYSNQIYFGQIP